MLCTVRRIQLFTSMHLCEGRRLKCLYIAVLLLKGVHSTSTALLCNKAVEVPEVVNVAELDESYRSVSDISQPTSLSASSSFFQTTVTLHVYFWFTHANKSDSLTLSATCFLKITTQTHITALCLSTAGLLGISLLSPDFLSSRVTSASSG